MSTTQTPTKQADFLLNNCGSVSLVTPLNEAAEKHLRAHVAEDSLWFSGSLAVEARYIESLLATLQKQGVSMD